MVLVAAPVKDLGRLFGGGSGGHPIFNSGIDSFCFSGGCGDRLSGGGEKLYYIRNKSFFFLSDEDISDKVKMHPSQSNYITTAKTQ
ncbi:hypothetical protein Pyn_12231 [Prunus yedoensis var. nudiflora]|uniref:Uncharacterized protein n=1 Tax=Prunus yedoensis var. nudiflora TaxID=2094558 RepID=A0A314UV14_PRUYE|nr:hypothetical protein Pyn_12231 [Prunus yedoensis var. nudiflora]